MSVPALEATRPRCESRGLAGRPGLSSTQGGRAMGEHSEVFVGLDVAKAKNAVAIAESGRRGEVRYLGEIDNTPEATRRLIAKLSKTYRQMTFCYEAGPTGYGLYRLIE